MKPHVIVHMAASLDGKIVPRRWRPVDPADLGAYETLHAQLEGQAWLVGRVTGEAFAKGKAYPEADCASLGRDNWVAGLATSYAVVVDAHGKIAWGRSEIDGDRLVVILTRQVSDAHLAGLRADGVSYIFAGETDLDLGLALEILRRDLKIDRLLIEGGGHINGAFLRAGLVDEVSLLLLPVIDGAAGAPALFDGEDGQPAPISAMHLESSTPLNGGGVWLRYSLGNE